MTVASNMTVAKLISLLQTQDPTLEVRVAYPYGHAGVTWKTAPLVDVILAGPSGVIPTLIAQF